MKNLFLLLFLLPLMAASQNFHFSPRIGMMGYNGDLKAKPVTLSQTKPMFSLGARYDLTEHIMARSYITYGAVTGSDKKGTPSMQARNLDFSSKILDLELGAQYNILNLNNSWWTPYVFAGVGLNHFNPYTKDAGGAKNFLKPLSTEGQGFAPGVNNYSLTGLQIPLGFGVDYLLGEDHRIGLEFSYRYLFTDYLDDVSDRYVAEGDLQKARGSTAVELAFRGDEVSNRPYPVPGDIRGNPKGKDAYYYIGFTYTFRFWFDKYKQTSGIPGGKSDRKVGCPSTSGGF
ncbi:MAG: outer rane beta-barrel protein [Flavisolibacter sp.]|jgi:hypothetical protein|nr:outer rane beta-barrel protein [Flavisolibacter sp.]